MLASTLCAQRIRPYLLVLPLALTACAPNTLDRTIEGVLEEGDTRRKEDDSLVDYHDLRIKEGASVHITMTSKQFVPYLQVQGPLGNAVAPYEACDAQAPEKGACIRFQATESGTFRIYANSYDATGRGAYTLVVEELETSL